MDLPAEQFHVEQCFGGDDGIRATRRLPEESVALTKTERRHAQLEEGARELLALDPATTPRDWWSLRAMRAGDED